MKLKKEMSKILGIAALAGAGLSESRVALAQYTLVSLNDPSAAGATVPSGINDTGTVVGSYTVSAGVSANFIDTAGSYANFIGPTSDSDLNGINNLGQLVGTAYTSGPSGLSYNGYLQTGGASTAIAAPAAPTKTITNAISNTGLVAGYYFVNDSAIGYTEAGGVFSTFTDPNAYNTFVTGINSSGEVVGYYNPIGNSFGQEGFVYNGTTFTAINDPNGIGNTGVLGVNDLGQLVGAYTDSTGDVHGFVDTNGTFTTVDGPGTIDRTQINGINNNGTIIGYYEGSSDVMTGFVGTPIPVPEPSQSILGVVVCGGMIALSRRTRRQA